LPFFVVLIYQKKLTDTQVTNVTEVGLVVTVLGGVLTFELIDC